MEILFEEEINPLLKWQG